MSSPLTTLTLAGVSSGLHSFNLGDFKGGFVPTTRYMTASYVVCSDGVNQ